MMLVASDFQAEPALGDGVVEVQRHHGLHAVEAEALPQLDREQVGQRERVAEEAAVGGEVLAGVLGLVATEPSAGSSAAGPSGEPGVVVTAGQGGASERSAPVAVIEMSRVSVDQPATPSRSRVVFRSAEHRSTSTYRSVRMRRGSRADTQRTRADTGGFRWVRRDTSSSTPPVLGSLAWSSLVAALPLLVLFVLLGGLRVRAWLASLIALAVSLLVAVLVYGMPVGQAAPGRRRGRRLRVLPDPLDRHQRLVDLPDDGARPGTSTCSGARSARCRRDQRVQAVIIAFSFGALLEALAGFGAPVAICTIMLIGLGFEPIKAASVALVANTAPVAFGAIAVPITTLAQVTSLPESALGAVVGAPDAGSRGVRAVRAGGHRRRGARAFARPGPWR